MWIVALALRRPYTFVVMALVIILLTPITILRTPTDIFPDIDIPVVSVVWSYIGMSPQDMADRIVTNSERGINITVNDIEHMESQSVNGLGVIKIFFPSRHERTGRYRRNHRDLLRLRCAVFRPAQCRLWSSPIALPLHRSFSSD
jgi:multidrug efflux pump subunit AcrB